MEYSIQLRRQDIVKTEKVFGSGSIPSGITFIWKLIMQNWEEEALDVYFIHPIKHNIEEGLSSLFQIKSNTNTFQRLKIMKANM